MFLVDAAHEGGCGRQNFVDEDKDGLFGSKLDALADDVAELADGQVGRHEIFLLVYGRDVGLLDLLTDDLNPVSKTQSLPREVEAMLRRVPGFCRHTSV